MYFCLTDFWLSVSLDQEDDFQMVRNAIKEDFVHLVSFGHSLAIIPFYPDNEEGDILDKKEMKQYFCPLGDNENEQ